MKNDESEYVRRSVANNLNDISKDNPEIVIEIARKWKNESTKTDKLLKHACRTLLKKGDTRVLELFGFPRAKHIKINDFRVQESVLLGEKLEFSFVLETPKSNLGKLRIEYAIDFMKKNGRQSRKVFKISESYFSGYIKKVKRFHNFRKITTRKYYLGIHGLAIIVNGSEIRSSSFILRQEITPGSKQ